jgi:hypothetical protein
MLAWGVAGLAAGAAAGAGLLALTGATPPAQGSTSGTASGDRDPGSLIQATHLPPLLTLAGEATTLRYDVYCAPPGADPESGAPCAAAGTVYIRAGDAGPFRAVPLQLDEAAAQGRYAAAVPADIATSQSGFSYYAVLSSTTSGATTVLPSGGASAPQRSRPLVRPVEVRLGDHVFGSARAATQRVAAAGWGAGPGQVGLEPGSQLQPIGGSSFDVGATGVVGILDEANRRVLRFAPGVAAPTAVPVGVRGTIADLALGADEGMFVLETVGDAAAPPLLRSFDAVGRVLATSPVGDKGASALVLGAAGPVALAYPSNQWLPVALPGAGARSSRQVRGGPGRPLPSGGELVVEREGSEARIAELGPGGMRRSWRIQSSTPLAEVQLARPLGDKIVVVLRVYTDDRDEFDVLVLDDAGLVRRFAVASAAWAETAPLARFRLHGRSLYELGSTPAGVFIDRYDLEVSR